MYNEWVRLLTAARDAVCAVYATAHPPKRYRTLSNVEIYQHPRWDLDPSMFVWVRKKPGAKRVHDKSVPAIVRSTSGVSYRKEIKVPAPQFWPGGAIPKQMAEVIS